MRAVVFRYTEAEVLEASRLLYRMMPIMRFFRWVIALTAEQAAEIRAVLTAGVGASGAKRRGG
jgi:hypothetical protein